MGGREAQGPAQISVMTRNKRFLITTLMIVSVVPMYAQSEIPGSQIADLIQAIEVRNIASLEIFGVPPYALFRTNVTPERLEELWDYKIILRDLNSQLELHPEELIPVLRTAQIQLSATKLEAVDVRLGFIFLAKRPEGKRVVSIYFDTNWRHGVFNNMSVSFGPNFLFRLKKALHNSLANSLFYSFDSGPVGVQSKPR